MLQNLTTWQQFVHFLPACTMRYIIKQLEKAQFEYDQYQDKIVLNEYDPDHERVLCAQIVKFQKMLADKALLPPINQTERFLLSNGGIILLDGKPTEIFLDNALPGISKGIVTLTTPAGRALCGLKPGESATYELPVSRGKKSTIEVVEIWPYEAAKSVFYKKELAVA